ncbi:MAG: NUDIX domain-containing protein [Daejeonella sp.]
MSKKSAGILLYRYKNSVAEVFLVHMGGPFWQKKDKASWSIPKGEFESPELPLDAAIREMLEETGLKVEGDFTELKPVKQKSGKTIYAFAINQDFDPDSLKSNMFNLEWPPKSGKISAFAEIDKACWFDRNAALDKILPGQAPILEELFQKLMPN